MRDVTLLLVGAVLGAAISVLVKAFIDPVLDRRKRKTERRERWTEDAVEHATAVRARIHAALSDAISQGGLFDGEVLARAQLASLTDDCNPGPLTVAAEHDKSGKLDAPAAAAREAWMAVKFATMDAAYGAEPSSVEHEPENAVTAYDVALGNFVAAARSERI